MKTTIYRLHVEPAKGSTKGFSIDFRSLAQARRVADNLHAYFEPNREWLERIDRKASTKRKRIGRTIEL